MALAERAVRGGLMTRNHAMARYLGLPGIDGGDVLHAPSGSTTAGQGVEDGANPMPVPVETGGDGN